MLVCVRPSCQTVIYFSSPIRRYGKMDCPSSIPTRAVWFIFTPSPIVSMS